MKKNALIVLWNGNTIPMKPTFNRGCEITRAFASRGGRELENNGLTLVYPDDVSRSALSAGIDALVAKLKTMP